MKTFLWLCLPACFLLGLAACSRPAPPPPENVLRPTATIKDIMDSIVDPSADALWESVATIVTVTGIDERQPRTDEEWLAVRRDAVQLVEAPNLLIMEGRHVAKPGEKSPNPGVELAPEEIDKLISEDRPTFLKLARALQDAAIPAFQAIEAKNVEGLSDAGENDRYGVRELPPEILVSERRAAAAEPAVPAQAWKLVGDERRRGIGTCMAPMPAVEQPTAKEASA